LAGIYIHIPFCRKACHYCNFFFSTTLQLKNEVVEAILKEIELTPGKREEPIETIYLGGGTPSLLTPDELKRILGKLHQEFTISDSAEITLEANPDDINLTIAAAWRSMGINRLSIGVQSFHDSDLQWMNRAHTAAQGAMSIDVIRSVGFDNFSIDLIFGAPVTSMENWKENVSRAIQMNVPHISAYALTVEPETALEKMIRQKKKMDTDPDEQARQYEFLMDAMASAG
jgi:oxygen-independent coproporphyrinogen III oxidase